MPPRYHIAAYVTLMLLTPRPVYPTPWVQRRGQCGERALVCYLVCYKDAGEHLSASEHALQVRGDLSTHACTQTYWRAEHHKST